ncbi:MAG TPA: MFS transporter [Solirubrobacteraceae bacterium]|nr:MFS transporter [Solirubrobacteraceae bacterium]
MKVRALAPLRYRGFRLLISGQVASNAGDAFYAIALPWYVLSEHGGTVHLGVVLAAYGISRTGTLMVGGHVSDRLGPWRAMMAADVVRALALATLAIVAASCPARLALLVPIAIVVGAGEGIFLPGSFAITPALLDDEALQAGNALTSGATQLATLLGPALGGAVIALAGPAPAFAIDAASCLISALTLLAIRTAAQTHTGETHRSETRQPMTLPRMIAAEPVILLVFALSIAANLGSGGMSEVALPALAHGPLGAGAGGYGALIASFAAGALAGTLLAAQAPRPRRPALLASAAFLLSAIPIALIPYLGGTIPAAAALVCYGTLNGFANVLTITAVQRFAPRLLLGRIMGFLMLGSFGIFPVSVLLAGVVVHADGPAIFFPIAAALLALTVTLALTQETWREFGQQSHPQQPKPPVRTHCAPINLSKAQHQAIERA